MDRTGAALLGAVFCIATAGLVYELVAGTAATYLLGDSITQFSLIIGIYLFSMGIGSYLSRYVQEPLLPWFVRLELAVGLIGGFAAFLLFVAFARDGAFRLVLFLLVGAVGIGVGLEIPLLIRILRDRMKFEDLIARVLFFDYLGALAASLLFPMLLVPKLGLIRASLVLGLVNAVVGGCVVLLFWPQLQRRIRLMVECGLTVLVLVVGLYHADDMTRISEEDLYPDVIIHAQSTPYQRIVLTRSKGGELRLFLNSHLQFSSRDEYRYHEALVHPALASAPDRPLDVLILGGGDGLAVRELLRYPDVRSILLVDLDPAMTALFSAHSALVDLNRGSLMDERLRILNADAMVWLESEREPRFDVVVVDFPDPSSYGLGKLYTRTFYRMMSGHLRADGVAVVQSTSPMAARRSFWCIDATMRAAGLHTRPYHTFVPSFGEWGFILASPRPIGVPGRLRQPLPSLRFLSDRVLPGLFDFPADMAAVEGSPVNRLNDQALVRLYDEEWRALQ